VISAAAFQEKVLGRALWQKQRELCQAVQSHRKVAVKGCHGSGKTFVAAGLIPYELMAHDEAIVLIIAPTLRQVKLFWGEVEGAIRALPAPAPERSATGWRISENRYALGFSAAKGVNAQGFHGKRVLIIADEAVGINAEMWDAIEGIRAAGDVRLLKLCNPTVPSGPVYDDFTRLRGETCAITISAFDTPNLAGLTLEQLIALPELELDIAPVPWLTRRRWVREMYFKWGPTNPRFRARVLGEFPTQGTDSVFELAWIEAAGRDWTNDDLKPHLRPGLFIQVGLDIAGPGDDETVATARLGPFVLAMEAWPEADPLDKCLRFLGSVHGRFPDAQVIIAADTVGIGYHFARAIARAGYDVRQFIAQGAPLDPVRFWNAKAEAHFQLREWMQAKQIWGIFDEDTCAQLSDIRYREKAGKIEIEHKDEVRARGSSSPDRAESLVMAFAKLVPRYQTVVFG